MSDLQAWDLKSAAAIGSIYADHAGEGGFLGQVVDLIDDPDLERGATWLLKHHFDVGGEPLNDRLVRSTLAAVQGLDHWEAKLHILQIMSRLPVAEDQLDDVEAFVDECLSGDKKFVRAWAYSAFRDLAVQHPHLRGEATRLLDQALENETAGSVLSRVRRCISQGF